MLRALIALLVVLSVGGCAVGNTHRYDLGGAKLEVQSDQSVAVATVDARPAVLSGDKTPAFVGLMRGGFGNPFDIDTDSGRPLAEDVSISITKSLEASGISASKVSVPPRTDVEEARRLLLKQEADRYALLVLKKWKSDTYFNTGLSYDMALSILEANGSIAAETKLSGHDNLGSSGVPADARVNTEAAFKRKIETIFNDPAIKAALE